MATVNGIMVATAALGAGGRSTTGSGLPGGAMGDGVGATFSETFRSALASVAAESNAGAYDDPAIAARITALRTTLLSGASGQATDGAAQLGEGTGGAHAAPDMSAGPAGQPLTITAPTPAQSRQLLVLEQQQAAARVQRVHQSLTARYSAGASLPSAASGMLDISRFQPRSREEAEAFAQRLAIDVTEGQAQLEVVAGNLAIARHDLAHGAGTAQQVADLQQQFDRQQRYVASLADVVERSSGQALRSEAPAAPNSQAMSNLRDAAAHSSDAGAIDITMLGALDTVVAEEAATGNSQRLNRVTSRMSDALFQMIWHDNERRMERDAENARRAAEQRADDDRALERRREDQRVVDLVAQRHAQYRRELDPAREWAS